MFCYQFFYCSTFQLAVVCQHSEVSTIKTAIVQEVIHNLLETSDEILESQISVKLFGHLRVWVRDTRVSDIN